MLDESNTQIEEGIKEVANLEEKQHGAVTISLADRVAAAVERSLEKAGRHVEHQEVVQEAQKTVTEFAHDNPDLMASGGDWQKPYAEKCLEKVALDLTVKEKEDALKELNVKLVEDNQAFRKGGQELGKLVQQLKQKQQLLDGAQKDNQAFKQ